MSVNWSSDARHSDPHLKLAELLGRSRPRRGHWAEQVCVLVTLKSPFHSKYSVDIRRCVNVPVSDRSTCSAHHHHHHHHLAFSPSAIDHSPLHPPSCTSGEVGPLPFPVLCIWGMCHATHTHTHTLGETCPKRQDHGLYTKTVVTPQQRKASYCSIAVGDVGGDGAGDVVLFEFCDAAWKNSHIIYIFYIIDNIDIRHRCQSLQPLMTLCHLTSTSWILLDCSNPKSKNILYYLSLSYQSFTFGFTFWLLLCLLIWF